jgi:hypothetical protein
MVVLGVKDEKDLELWEDILIGEKFSTFIEPDIGNERTAIAVHPKCDHKLFKNEKLL